MELGPIYKFLPNIGPWKTNEWLDHLQIIITGTVSARIMATHMMVNISISTRSILMQFAAYERKFSCPHLEIKIMVIAKYHDYVKIYRLKTLKI
jgi:hypothetical protein